MPSHKSPPRPEASYILRKLAALAPSVAIRLTEIPRAEAVPAIVKALKLAPLTGDSEEEGERAVLETAERLAVWLHEPELLSEDGVSLSPAESDAWDALSAEVLSAGVRLDSSERR